MTRLCAPLVLIACATPAAPPANHSARGPEPVGPCPQFLGEIGGAHFALAHEIFPGCGEMPFPYDFAVCRGECPRVCRSKTSGLVEATLRDEYDDEGRWVSWHIEGGNADVIGVSCTRVHGVVMSCAEHIKNTADQIATLERDGAGRVTTLEDASGTTTFKYERGLIVEATVDGSAIAFDYDTQRRLVHEVSNTGTTTYDYDALGRLHHRRNADGTTMTYTYDAHGRLIAVDSPPLTESWTFEYDSAGRPIRSHGHLSPDDRWDMQYWYSCP